MRTRAASTLIALLAALLWPAPAIAQVDVSLELFGVGGIARPGDWAGVRLALRDPGAQVRPVRVRLETRDADGDRALWQRDATLNPGVSQGVWLYARLPYTLRRSDTFRATVVADDGTELGAAVLPVQTVIDAESPLVGLIGRASAGLDRYRVPDEPGSTSPATGHEWIEFALIDPDQLAAAMPDSWTGLAAMKTIVWTEGAAADLRAPAAAALVEWVRRGGHLVVVVPSDGGGWPTATGPLADALPRVAFSRREGVDLDRYRPLLTPNPASPLPAGEIVHLLTPDAGAPPDEASVVLAGPGDEPVVVRRLLGAGAVTMIGIDVARRDVAAWIEPQRFWHRVLGERFDVLSSARMQALASATPPANFRSRTPVWTDDAVAQLINKTGRAGVGVLLGVVVFTVYWVVAGPGGYALLRRARLAKHSWLVFVGVSAVFTAIAWGGASALRPARVEVAHLSVIDHVFGQNTVRVRTWAGAFLPRYGLTTIAVDHDDPALRHALTPWASPGSASDAFPDPRSYTIDARRPESIAFPSRATVKQVRLDWLGSPPWRSIVPQDPIALSEAGQLSGVLTHGLPAPLEDVTIMLVLRQQVFTQLPPGALQASTLAWRLSGSWNPGEPLDLASLAASGRATRGDAYLDSIEQTARRWSTVLRAPDPSDAFDKLETLAWGPMIGPPDYTRPPSTTGFPARIHQRVGHGLDLARWFTQPCLIVTGRAATPLPAPLTIDGQTPPSTGNSLLRWVYPLPANPPAAVEDRT